MSKPHWLPAQGQTVYVFDHLDDEITSTKWTENDPWLLELLQQGKVFASRFEAQNAQNAQRSLKPKQAHN